MKRIFTALIILSLSLLCGVTAHAQTSVTITPSGPGADSGAATVVDWGAEEAPLSVLPMDGSNTAAVSAVAVPVREAGAEAYPMSVESVTENGVPIVKKTYELAPGADPQALVRAFEQDGYCFSCREILRRELPGETLTRQASKTALTESESDDKAEIMRHFPDTIDHEQDGYSGQLSIDPSSFSTEAASYERYTYPYTKTREIPGLERNDPSYIEREWNGMALTGVSFKAAADGKYTAFATYKGTAWGERASGYVTTAVYRGELTKSAPGNVLYTVVYEGAPLLPELTAAEPNPATPEQEQTLQSAVTETDTESAEPSAPAELPAAENEPPYIFLIVCGCIFLLGAVAAPICTTIIFMKERKQTREEIETLKSLVRAGQ